MNYRKISSTATALAVVAMLAACAPSQDTAKLKVANEMIQAWNMLDWDGICELFAEDAVMHSMMVEPIRGRDEICKHFGGYEEGLERIELQVAHIGTVDDVVMIERVDDFDYNGRHSRVPVVGVMEIADGKITEWREYYDRPTLLKAVLPEPPSAEAQLEQARQQIGEALAKLQADWNAGRMDDYLDAYAKGDELSVLFSDQALRGWQAVHDLFTGTWATEEAMGDFEVTDLSVELLQPGLAMASGSFEHHFLDQEVKGAFSQLWQQDGDGAWRIVHEHTSGGPVEG